MSGTGKRLAAFLAASMTLAAASSGLALAEKNAPEAAPRLSGAEEQEQSDTRYETESGDGNSALSLEAALDWIPNAGLSALSNDGAPDDGALNDGDDNGGRTDQTPETGKEPTNTPTPDPTNAPTREPTKTPTREPTNAPTLEPTKTPTPEPTKASTPVKAAEESGDAALIINPEEGAGLAAAVLVKPTATHTPTPTVKIEIREPTPAKPIEPGVTHRPDDVSPTPAPTRTPTPTKGDDREPTPAKPIEPGVTHRPDGVSPTPKPSPTVKIEIREPTPAKPIEPGVTHRPDDLSPTPIDGADASGTVDARRSNASGNNDNNNNNAPENIGSAGPSVDNYSSAAELTESAQKAEEDLRKLLERVTVTSEALSSVSFGDIESKMRAQNFQILSFQATIDYLETMDYQKLTDDMRKQLNALAEGQFAMLDLSRITGESVRDSYAYNQLTQGYNALRTQFDNLKDGETQRDNLTTIRQLKSVQDQLVTGGQTLYIALVGMETQKGALERQTAAMNRVIETMELQYQQGGISALRLQQYRSQRASLISASETLGMTIRTMKMQLENMMGAAPTGEIRIGSLPSVTESQLSEMNVERDLQSAMSNSYELRAAAKTLEDQEETYEDAIQAVRYDEKKEAYKRADAAWNAAKNTYNATLQSYELRFRTLYEQVHDYYQVWDASRTALAAREADYQAAQLRYEQGNLSQNALLDARDELETAKETLAGHANNLFSAYNSYRWAVQAGILTQSA